MSCQPNAQLSDQGVKSEMSTPGSSEMRRPDIVCVLGMHRSGTSLLTRILNLIGLYLGSEQVSIQPAEDNPKGHWEHSDIVSLNDAILKRYGGSWDEPPLLPTDWETASLLDDLRQRAQVLIEDQFAGVHLWGWKDPRTCLTLPFWQQLLPEMRYLICLRNPWDVARSLQHRNSFSAEKSSSLWFRYVNSAFEHSEGKRRLVVFYEDLMDNCLRELQRLSDFLGKPELAKQAEVQKSVQEFAEQSLQHHRTSIVQATAHPGIALRTRALYIAQRITVGFGRKEIVEQGFDREIERALDILNLYSSKAAGRANPSIEQLAEVDIQLAAKDDTIEVLQTLSAELAEENRALASKAESAKESVAELERVVAEREWVVAERETQVGQLEGIVAERERVITQQDNRIVALNNGLIERDGHIASLYHAIAKFEAAPLRRVIRVTRRGIAKLTSSLRSGS